LCHFEPLTQLANRFVSLTNPARSDLSIRGHKSELGKLTFKPRRLHISAINLGDFLKLLCTSISESTAAQSDTNHQQAIGTPCALHPNRNRSCWTQLVVELARTSSVAKTATS